MMSLIYSYIQVDSNLYTHVYVYMQGVCSKHLLFQLDNISMSKRRSRQKCYPDIERA